MSRYRFRAWPLGDGLRAEVRNIGAGRSYAVEPLAAAQSILRGRQISAGSDAERDLGVFDKWDANGWGEALSFYLATLDQDFADVGEDFAIAHEEVLESYAREKPIPREHYPATTNRVPLPAPSTQDPMERGGVLRSRRTTLVPSAAVLTLGALSTIVWRATRKLERFRATAISSDPLRAMVNFGPSIDIYVAVHDVVGLTSGIYRYNLSSHELWQVATGDFRQQMREALVGQPAPATAAVTVVYVSDVPRHQWRYRHARALRGLWIDSAKVVNELLWSLSSSRIIPHMSPAVHDSTMCELLQLEPSLDNEIVYTVSFGGPTGDQT